MSFTGKARVVIDFGNSTTRFMVKCGKYKSDIQTVSNRFSPVPPGYTAPDTYADDPTALVFDYAGVRYVTGSLADREFASSIEKPSAIQPKWDSKATLLSFQAVMYHAYKALSVITGAAPEAQNITWDVTCLVPPLQVDAKDKMMAHLKSVEAISFVYPTEFSVGLTIEEIKVMPEGTTAFFATVFNENKTIRSGYETLKTSKVLLVDIGAGTTDVSVVDSLRVVDTSRDTFSYGGNNVYQHVGRVLKSQGRNLKENDLIEGVIRGYVQDGVTSLDIRPHIDGANQRIANALANSIRATFEASLIDPRSLTHLLVVGGGAVPVEGITSLGEHILNTLRVYAPNLQTLHTPEGFDLRMLNIIGAINLSE